MVVTQLLLAARARLTEFTLGDNALGELTMNKNGRLRVSAKGGLYTNASGALAAVNDAVVSDVSDASIVRFHVKDTTATAIAAGAFVFEGSLDSTNGTDGTWFTVQALRSNANTTETNVPVLALSAGAGLGYSWQASVNGIQWFRVRCTTAVTAGATATWTIVPAAFATEPNPSVPTHAVTGSGTFTVAGTATTTPVTGTAYGLTTAATTNAASIKTSAGNVTEISISNLTAATIYVKLYNSATAPTAGAGTPRTVIPVAAGATINIDYGPLGKRFETGIGITVTANAVITDATAVGAGALINATYL
jgi:hypothetical protein